MLCILDGWGLSARTEANAVALGRTPNFDRIWQECPHTQLTASGSDVGLAPGVMGNSEVGHLNIGAGRIVWQDSLLIDQSITDGSFFDNETLLGAMRHALARGTRLHLMGLVSNGSVHSSEGHYFALLELAARVGLRAGQVLVHAFTDGRDTPPQSGEGYLARLLQQMVVTGVGAVASVIGRYYAMDRDNRWQRVQQAYDCLTSGKGHRAADALDAVRQAYARGETDEFIAATAVLDAGGELRPRVADDDAVIFFNYRSDRGRELTQSFIDAEFNAHLRAVSEQPGAAEAENPPVVTRFTREVWPRTNFVTMTRYAANLPCPIAFEPRPQRNGLGEVVAAAGKTQLRMAETEKYPHVTYFFSGGNETPWPGEERIMVASPKVATYDLQPEMSAPEVTEKVTAAIRSGRFDLIILNFANPDMVGHTGVLAAAIKAVETVDSGLGEILSAIEASSGALLVIADHGNCEQMIDYETGQPHTAHTTNPVPCILVGQSTEGASLRSGGRLADLAPTLLGLLGVPPSPAMTGADLRQTASGAGAAATAAVDAGISEQVAALRTALEVVTASCRFYVMAVFALDSSPAPAAGGAPDTEGIRDTVRTLAISNENLRRQLQDRLRAAGGEAVTGDEASPRPFNTALSMLEIAGAAVATERDSAARWNEAGAAAAGDETRRLWQGLAQAARERQEQLAAVQAR